MYDLDEILLGFHHVVDALVRHRCLVDNLRVLATFDALGCTRMIGDGEPPFRFGSRHHPPGAVATGVEALIVSLASHDDGTSSHAPWNDAQIAQASTHGAFAGHEHILVVVMLLVESRFQLLAGTNRDLSEAIRRGSFREDLYARINLWSFTLPGLAQRKEDIEPNLEYELVKWTTKSGHRITFNNEARRAFLKFATGASAAWSGNFRDLNAAMIRMATLAPGGRINVATVNEEIERLDAVWDGAEDAGLDGLLSAKALRELDRFDRVQLADVLSVCRESASLSAAGRILFAASRKKKAQPNDADRLRKYLARFGLDWDRVRANAR